MYRIIERKKNAWRGLGSWHQLLTGGWNVSIVLEHGWTRACLSRRRDWRSPAYVSQLLDPVKHYEWSVYMHGWIDHNEIGCVFWPVLHWYMEMRVLGCNSAGGFVVEERVTQRKSSIQDRTGLLPDEPCRQRDKASASEASPLWSCRHGVWLSSTETHTWERRLDTRRHSRENSHWSPLHFFPLFLCVNMWTCLHHVQCATALYFLRKLFSRIVEWPITLLSCL